MMKNTRGFTLIELLVVVAIIGVLIGILVPTIGAAREQANRQACAANLAGIAKSMCIYANENADAFPTVVSSTLASIGTAPTGGVDTGSADASTAGSTLFATSTPRTATQCLWLLVILGQGQPQQFVCRSDSASASLKTTSTSSQNWAGDFAGSTNLSYSMASPWSDGTTSGSPGSMPRAPWWKNNADSGQPILADGIKKDADFEKAADVAPSHRGAGSNVSFGDGHAEWTPITKIAATSKYQLNVPAGATAPDSSGIFATTATVAGPYAAPAAISTTKVNGVYDMIFTPALTGREFDLSRRYDPTLRGPRLNPWAAFFWGLSPTARLAEAIPARTPDPPASPIPIASRYPPPALPALAPDFGSSL